MHWFETIWPIYAGFHSSSCYSSSTKKNKTQIWLLAQKNSGRLQLVWSIVSFFPVLKIALLNHKKTTNKTVNRFLEFFVLVPRIRPKVSRNISYTSVTDVLGFLWVPMTLPVVYLVGKMVSLYCRALSSCGVPTKKVGMNWVRSSHDMLCKALLMCLQVAIGIKGRKC